MRGQWEFIQCTLYINKSCSTPQLKYFVNKIKRGTPPNIWMGNSTETLSTSTYIGTYTWLRWQNDRRVMSLMTVTVMLLADRVNKRNEKSQKKKKSIKWLLLACCQLFLLFFFFFYVSLPMYRVANEQPGHSQKLSLMSRWNPFIWAASAKWRIRNFRKKNENGIKKRERGTYF